ncbi:Hypothetical protein D9617_27g045490 [Elsinoe fawcettii]|nr:Hypothetical protein D9617_27g045490 [Elsinoe fawcettii]
MTKPFILVVPGSFSPASAYDALISLLRTSGYSALALQLPSTCKRYPKEPATMAEDAAQIRTVVETLVAQGREVVVVCHSYGGTPTTEALAGVKGVRRVVYMTAVVPRVGEDQMKAMQMEGFEALDVHGGYMHINPALFAGAVANDMPWELAYEKMLTLPHHSKASFEGVVTQAAYKDVPVSYIFCEKDLVISPEKQKGFIEVVEQESGNKVDVVSLDSGHAPNWSVPEKLRDIIIELAEK